MMLLGLLTNHDIDTVWVRDGEADPTDTDLMVVIKGKMARE
jgi:hypothetical protein